jgi:alanine dehydrogenase
VLLGGVPGVPPADVVILGGGVAGSHAAFISVGMGATVTVVDRNPEALRRIANQLGTHVRTIFSTRDAVETVCRRADLVICTVLVPGAAAPKLISAATVKAMKPGAVIVDVAIDQGGCAETSRPTTHSKPTFVVDESMMSCIIASPTCLARWRVPRPSRSTMERCRSFLNLPMKALGVRWVRTRTCATV